jgi:hypothetical protein
VCVQNFNVGEVFVYGSNNNVGNKIIDRTIEKKREGEEQNTNGSF